jgi:hypothetical protein
MQRNGSMVRAKTNAKHWYRMTGCNNEGCVDWCAAQWLGYGTVQVFGAAGKAVWVGKGALWCSAACRVADYVAACLDSAMLPRKASS